MALPEAGLYGFLSTTTAVTAVVGTRIYPILLPPGVTLPAMTYRRLSGAPLEETLDGCFLQEVRLLITIWGDEYDIIKELTETLKTALHNKQGLLGDADIKSMSWERDADIFDEETLTKGVESEYAVTV